MVPVRESDLGRLVAHAEPEHVDELRAGEDDLASRPHLEAGGFVNEVHIERGQIPVREPTLDEALHRPSSISGFIPSFMKALRLAILRPMTPMEKAIVQALVAVAWADGEVEGPEEGVVEGLLAGFDASDDEERELLTWAKTPRSLGEVDLESLDADARELLLSNAALLVTADGDESIAERDVLTGLAARLGLDADAALDLVRRTHGKPPPSST